MRPSVLDTCPTGSIRSIAWFTPKVDLKGHNLHYINTHIQLARCYEYIVLDICEIVTPSHLHSHHSLIMGN
jgi:hypothetical protein